MRIKTEKSWNLGEGITKAFDLSFSVDEAGNIHFHAGDVGYGGESSVGGKVDDKTAAEIIDCLRDLLAEKQRDSAPAFKRSSP